MTDKNKKDNKNDNFKKEFSKPIKNPKSGISTVYNSMHMATASKKKPPKK